LIKMNIVKSMFRKFSYAARPFVLAAGLGLGILSAVSCGDSVDYTYNYYEDSPNMEVYETNVLLKEYGVGKLFPKEVEVSEDALVGDMDVNGEDDALIVLKIKESYPHKSIVYLIKDFKSRTPVVKTHEIIGGTPFNISAVDFTGDDVPEIVIRASGLTLWIFETQNFEKILEADIFSYNGERRLRPSRTGEFYNWVPLFRYINNDGKKEILFFFDALNCRSDYPVASNPRCIYGSYTANGYPHRAMVFTLEGNRYVHNKEISNALEELNAVWSEPYCSTDSIRSRDLLEVARRYNPDTVLTAVRSIPILLTERRGDVFRDYEGILSDYINFSGHSANSAIQMLVNYGSKFGFMQQVGSISQRARNVIC
jgi:hypothetical protein